MNAQLIPVPFEGDTLYLTVHDGEPYAPVKPYCENLGLAWQPQAQKLQSHSKRWGVTILVIPTAGGKQEMLCLPLRKFPAWLNSIEVRKTRPELQGKLEHYQEECDAVLWRYWNDGRADNPRVSAGPAELENLRAELQRRDRSNERMVMELADRVEALKLENNALKDELLSLYRAGGHALIHPPKAAPRGRHVAKAGGAA
jgi:hypothetical protein